MPGQRRDHWPSHAGPEALAGPREQQLESNFQATTIVDQNQRARSISAFRQWMTVAILLLLNVLAFVDRSIIALMVQPIKRSLQVSDFQIGLVQGLAFASFYAVCALPLGWALDRFPKRPIVYVCITIWSVASAACGLAHSFVHLLFARFAVGFGEATLTPASYVFISGIFPKARLSTALSIYGLGGSFGAAIAMIVGGLIVSMTAGTVTVPLLGPVESWRFVFFVTGLPGVVLALLIFLVPDVDSRGDAAATREKVPDASAFVRSRRAFLTCHFLGFSLLAMMAGGATSWLPTFLIRHHGWTSAQAGAGIAVTILFLTAGVMTGGIVVDALTRRGMRNAHFRYHMVLTIFAFLFAIAAFAFASPYLNLLLIGLALGCSAMAGVGASALQIVTPPALRGRISAMYLMAVSIIGTGGGPLVVAVFTDFILKDEAKVGTSIALTYALFAPLAFLCFFFGSRFMLGAIDQLEATEQPSGSMTRFSPKSTVNGDPQCAQP